MGSKSHQAHACEVKAAAEAGVPVPAVLDTIDTVFDVEAHMVRHLGGPTHTWCDADAPFDVRVHMIPPSPSRASFVLYTTGMSSRGMAVPSDVRQGDELRHAELMMMLPPAWFGRTGDPSRCEDPRALWPVRLLGALARYPHITHSWLGFGHTVPNGEPPAPFADNTGLCCALLLPPVRVPSDFYDLRLASGRVINIYAVVPVYAEELQLKLTRGVGALLDRFDREGVSELLDQGRVNTCRGWLDVLAMN